MPGVILLVNQQVPLVFYCLYAFLIVRNPILAKELNVDFCDLNFISPEDERAAQSEYINATAIDEENMIPDKGPPHNRIKRQANSAQRPYTIETAIFVDSHLKQRFQNRLHDLQRLVLSIMHEVQLIYNYQSMKVPIKIVVARYEVLDKADNGPNTAGGDIDRYLDNFCSWQARKFRTANSDNRWDHALMLTGLDLFKESGGKRNKKVLGLAWVNGMCKPTYSCTLNEGKSFEAAFVIAHEMAHSLGILHDGKGNNCDPDKYLMSEKTGPGKVNWSPCSNKYLENFLNRGNARCLENDVAPPPELDFRAVSRLPGEQYNPDLQCQLALGTQYKAYYSAKEPFNDICRELWCLSGSWATPAHPALEGSACGPAGEKCFQGSCSLTRGLRAIRGKPAANNRPVANRPGGGGGGGGSPSRLRITLGLGVAPSPFRRRTTMEALPASSEIQAGESSSTFLSGIRNLWDKLITGVSSWLKGL